MELIILNIGPPKRADPNPPFFHHGNDGHHRNPDDFRPCLSSCIGQRQKPLPTKMLRPPMLASINNSGSTSRFGTDQYRAGCLVLDTDYFVETKKPP